MKREDAFYHKILLMTGLNDGYDEWLNYYLETENPLSDVVLELACCDSDVNKIISVLHNFCTEQPFDVAAVCDRVRLFFKNAYHANKMDKKEIVSTMYRLTLSVGDPGDFDIDLWGSMAYLSEYYSLTEEGMISWERFDFAFFSYLDNGTPLDSDLLWNANAKWSKQNMNNINKTLYIPLYGKSYVSKKGLFLNDKKAEEIWEAEGFSLKGRSGSKWLAYYMGIRSAVFDEWLKQEMSKATNAAVIHIGCGLDSRIIRVGANDCKWYDVDFPEVIKERERYYSETENYKMLAGDARDCKWLSGIKETKHAIVIMEGVSMYLTVEQMRSLADSLCAHFESLILLVDAYTSFAAKMSKRRNPVNDVGVTEVYGIDAPEAYQSGELLFVKEHTMIPKQYIDELKGFEKFIFANLYAGSLSKKLYRLYEYQKK